MTAFAICSAACDVALSRRPRSRTAPDTTFYSVASIEVKPSAGRRQWQALKQYSDSCRINTASLRTELFEQADRPGHLLLVETWQTPAAFDAAHRHCASD